MHLDVDYPGVKGKNLVALSPQPKVFTPEKPTG